jgi:LysR family transcriptional regulator, nitrogen assimilation regulatory protein
MADTPHLPIAPGFNTQSGDMDLSLREPPALDIRQLYYFVTLAEQGSISAAAAVLGLAQPTLSENLSRLERKLAVRLVKRSGRGIQLTEAGRVLAHHARGVIRATNTALDEIRRASDMPSGPAMIGLPPSLSLVLSVPLAETIQSEYPAIRLRIAEAMSGDILQWIQSERLDLGCVYDPPSRTTTNFEPILEEKLFLIAAPDSIPDGVTRNEDGNASITGLQLQALPLVLPGTSQGARTVVERVARAAGISLDVVMEIDSLPHIITMATRASAYTILPHAAVIEEIAQGLLVLIEIVEPTMTRTAYIARKRSRPISQASATVEAAVRTIIAEIIERFQLEAVVPGKIERSLRSDP